MTDLKVTRTVRTDRSVDELWALVGDGEAWAQWMVDESDVVVEPGSSGTVRDGDVERTVTIDRVDGRRVAFSWWPADDEHLASTVELLVVPAGGGAVLHITERFGAPVAAASVSSGFLWDVRTLLLVLATAPGLVATA